MLLNFNTPVCFNNKTDQPHPVLEWIDSYFVSSEKYLCGRVTSIKDRIFEVSIKTQTQRPLTCWIKRLSYLTVIIPIIMLIAKSIFRYVYTFEIENLKQKKVIRLLNEFKQGDNDSLKNVQTQLKKVEQILSYRGLAVNEAFENHALHDCMTDITIQAKNNESSKKTWGVFLEAMDNLKLIYPGGKCVKLDTSPEKLLLAGSELKDQKIVVEMLSPDSLELKKINDEIFEIFNESFANKTSSRDILEILNRYYSFSFVVAKDETTQKVLGFSAVQLINGMIQKFLGDSVIESEGSVRPKWLIGSFARKANAAKRGVATQMMKFLTEQVFNKQPSYLQVRTNNDQAIKLYENFGFEKMSVLKDYYSDPNQDAYLMLRPA